MMQVPPVSMRRVGRCKSASAADVQFRSRWRLRNCQHERVPVTSCSENSASEWSQKLATRLSLANDADEMMCRRHQCNAEAQSCIPPGPVSSHTTVSPFHTECHCIACCSCSPFDRHSGNCPAFTFPVGTLSVRRALSLDSGLALCHSCSQRLSADRDSSSANPADLVQNCEADTAIHKSSSVPACCSSQMRYYAAGISFDSLNDDTCQTHSTVGVNSAGSDSSTVCNGAESTLVINQSPLLPDENLVSTTVDYMSDQVSPLEYHKRFEVCMFLTHIWIKFQSAHYLHILTSFKD